jgi:hypothetical protein
LRNIAQALVGGCVNVLRASTASTEVVPEAEGYVGAVLSIRGAEACIGILSHNGTMPDAEGTTVGKFLAIVSKDSILIGFVTRFPLKCRTSRANKATWPPLAWT